MYKDANGEKVKEFSFYRVKKGTPNKVIYVGSLKFEKELPLEQRIRETFFSSYERIENPAEYAEMLKSQAHDLSRAERLINNYLKISKNPPKDPKLPNITLEFAFE